MFFPFLKENEFLSPKESGDWQRSVRGKQTAGTVTAAASCSATHSISWSFSIWSICVSIRPATGNVVSTLRISKSWQQHISGVYLWCSEVLKMLRSPTVNFIIYSEVEKSGTNQYRGGSFPNSDLLLSLLIRRICSESEQRVLGFFYFKIIF